MILGGEGPETGIVYPYISKRLAKTYGGMAVQTEHRFYGQSQPLGKHATIDDLVQYFSPEQALADWVKLLRHLKRQRGCDIRNKTSSMYCPIVTIGGSYPGFLSAVFRLVYPDVVGTFVEKEKRRPLLKMCCLTPVSHFFSIFRYWIRIGCTNDTQCSASGPIRF